MDVYLFFILMTTAEGILGLGVFLDFSIFFFKLSASICAFNFIHVSSIVTSVAPESSASTWLR